MVASPTTFDELARQPGDALDVAIGAALIARDEYPALDVPRLLARFDELADGLEPLHGKPPVEQAQRLSAWMYGDLGFAGDEESYYDPRNSLLPDVLDRRRGIPISLALVYAELGRRRGVDVRGVGFPGHFLAAVTGGEDVAVLVDPFFGGQLLDEPRLMGLLSRVAAQVGQDPASWNVAELVRFSSGREILARWLMNLRGIYLGRGDHARALVVLDRLLALAPDSAVTLRDRGLLAARLGSVQLARSDLARALELDPSLPDADRLRAELERLGRAPRWVS
jgi:regulator of sirC expression with transglutaminase-like and TPR domain